MDMQTMELVSQIAISKVAERHGVSEAEIREEMEKALHLAWNNGDDSAMDVQDRMFPEGLPGLDAFISMIAEAVSSIKNDL